MLFGVSPATLLAQIFTGLVLGGIYVLLALGLSLIFGLMTVVNFAHGAFYMWGAYLGFLVLALTGNFWLALLVGPLAVGLIGLATERGLVRKLYGRDPNDPLLLTFGLSFVLVATIRILFGKSGRAFDPPPILSGSLNLGFTVFPAYRLFVIAMTAAVVITLWYILERTDLGLVIRAGTRDSLMVRLLGIDVGRIWWLVFGIGIALAGLGGVLAAPMRGVYPEMGISMLIESFVVVVVGGMGSLPGAVVSGIVIGQVVSLTTLFNPKLADIMIFVFMGAVLLVRPSGLFGEAGLLE